MTNETSLPRGCGVLHQKSNLFMWMFITVAVVGICGNTFSIALLAKKRRGSGKILSDIYRVYVIALGIADNGMLFFTAILRYVVVSWLYDPVYSGWVYEKYLCRWHRLFMHTSHNAAVWLLVMMACDRFLAVCFPFVYREQQHRPNNAVKVTVFVYICSFVLATPFLAAGPQYHEAKLSDLEQLLIDMPDPKLCGKDASFCLDKTVKSEARNVTKLVNPFDCQHPDRESIVSLIREQTNSTKWDGVSPLNIPGNTTVRLIFGCSLTSAMTKQQAFVVNVVFHIFLSILLPYFALVLLNAAIVWKLNCRQEKPSYAEGRHKLNVRVTIMMLVICFTFILLWLPQVISLLSHVDAYAHSCDSDQVFSAVAALFSLSNSALNFALYCLTVSKFRKAAVVALLDLFHFCPGAKAVAAKYRVALERKNSSTSSARRARVREHLRELVINSKMSATDDHGKVRLVHLKSLESTAMPTTSEAKPTYV